MFEQQIINAIAIIALQPGKDQYGNEQQSPLLTVIKEWVKNNSGNIVKEVFDKIDVDVFATKVADNILEMIKSSFWGYESNKDKFNKDLREKVLLIMATKIAEEKLKEE